MARNTAPAVGLICWKLLQENKGGEIAGVFPADHIVTDEPEFGRVVELAVKCAAKDQIVTVGIQPQYPATGFGYIECEDADVETDGHLAAKRVKGFREKPNLETARKFISQKRFFWNAGMFIFKVDVMVAEFKKNLPKMWESICQLKPDLSNLEDIYKSLDPVSVDIGIMEKAANQACIPCEIGWSDLGSWDDYAKFAESEKLAPKHFEVTEIGASNCFVYSLKNKTIGLVGVENLIIVETPDALLVAEKGHSQNIKELVEQLGKKNKNVTKEHGFDFRPWGKYEVISDSDEFKIKVIAVNGESQLSYQSHLHRSEHWVVIEGEGEVVINEQVLKVTPGSSIVIPQNSKHRIRNTGKKVLRFVEVQTGNYFGEDDITRYADDYKRT
jgi:mannose-1-phosphate guanylyltransferase/mannose-1-phosphate guanylyltransferase/mannose-6-phosphate isomerase